MRTARPTPPCNRSWQPVETASEGCIQKRTNKPPVSARVLRSLSPVEMRTARPTPPCNRNWQPVETASEGCIKNKQTNRPPTSARVLRSLSLVEMRTARPTPPCNRDWQPVETASEGCIENKQTNNNNAPPISLHPRHSALLLAPTDHALRHFSA